MVIYLNGSINSGKTTIAKLIIRQLPQTVHIEVDDLRHFADCLTLEDVIPFCWEDALTLTQHWVERDFNVVVSWPIAEQQHRQFVRTLAETNTPLYTFTLSPRLEIALRDRGRRKLTERERHRITELYASGMHIPSFGKVIDN